MLKKNTPNGTTIHSGLRGSAKSALIWTAIAGSILLSASSASADPMDQWRAQIFDNLNRQIEQFQRTPMFAPRYDNEPDFSAQRYRNSSGNNGFGSSGSPTSTYRQFGTGSGLVDCGWGPGGACK